MTPDSQTIPIEDSYGTVLVLVALWAVLWVLIGLFWASALTQALVHLVLMVAMRRRWIALTRGDTG